MVGTTTSGSQGAGAFAHTVTDRPDPGSASLHQDEASFKKPLAAAWAESTQAFVDAGRTVAGAERRVRAALRTIATLKRFAAEVERHLRARSFHTLPGLTSKCQRLEGCHQLTVEPWRGVFLVDADGGQVVALLFSKAPHSLDDRLGELVAGYARPSPDVPGQV